MDYRPDPRPLIGFDTETHRIGPNCIAPPLVCIQWAVNNGDGTYTAEVETKPTATSTIESVILNPDSIKVLHNAAFDLAVLYMDDPSRISKIFEMLDAGAFADTYIREKLLMLATCGKVDAIVLPDGSEKKIKHSLAALVLKYLNRDISATKTDDEDQWRINYQALEGTPVETWPAEAIQYAKDDAILVLQVYEAQEARRREIIAERGIDPFVTQDFRVQVAFVLQLMTMRGMATDIHERRKVEAMLAEALKPEKLDLLVKTGILRPGQEPKPYANGAKVHSPDCTDKKNCSCPPKMTAAIEPSRDMGRLRAHVLDLARKYPQITLRYTEKTEKFPEGQLQVDAEFMDEYADLDPVLTQYRDREAIQKLVTTELPRMSWEGQPAAVVHPNYDPLKETGRTSSFGGKLYPAFNCQNVDPRIRPCYVPRAGHLLFSIDYSSMELGTAAQKCLDLVGGSVLADIINREKDYDPHAYLGAQLAFRFDADFRKACMDAGQTSPEAIFHLFLACKKHSDPKVQALYKHYRTFAKPTNLGFPGGLGAETFIKYAKATFGVIVDLEMAKDLKRFWMETFPEFPAYFEHINRQCIDPHNQDPEGGNLYHYTTPFGMYRAGATYCACCNGQALQSPSAEGALLALYNVVRGCYDPAMNSILYGRVFPIAFIHDEIVGEIVDDEHKTEAMQEIIRIMVAAMQIITPKVKARANPALMRRWDKNAEAVYDEQGRLLVWEPKKE